MFLVELASYCSETVVFARDDSLACMLICWKQTNMNN